MHTGVNLDEKDALLIGRMMPILNESQRRIFLASFKEYKGYGSGTEISALTKVSAETLNKGRKELEGLEVDPTGRGKSSDRRIRAPGGGRKSVYEVYPNIKEEVQALVDESTLGDPQSPLKWTVKSGRTIRDELEKEGIVVSDRTVHKILQDMDYSLQQNKKYTESGNPGPDRDPQFRFISQQTKDFIDRGLPVISVDAKKKELVGDYKNAGAEYRKKDDPRKVLDHDFVGELGHANPFGIYDIGLNEGFVNVGISSDTAEFAVNGISNWWHLMGQYRYPDAKDVMITADGGGSNSSRSRLWKAELQELADFTGLTFHVRHFPPGTSKWNKIEHRLFSFISINWKGQPLKTYEIIVNLIGSTTNESGLKVRCVLDTWEYEKGRQVPADVSNAINIKREEWRGDWNYTIAPHEE